MHSERIEPGFYRHWNGERHITLSEYDHNAIRYGAMRIDWTRPVPELCVTDAQKMSEYMRLKAEEERQKYIAANRERYLESLAQEGER
jgi:hypothetical protein